MEHPTERLDERPLTSPGAFLDVLRDHPEWSDRSRDALVARLVEKFPPEAVVPEVRRRLADLSGGDAETVLHLVEVYAEPRLLDDLAAALKRQPDLAPERAWMALALLDGAGRLDPHPALREWWNDLQELFDDDPIEQLVAQIEDDPDGLWLALQGLGAVEPEVRPQIVAGLAAQPPGPGLVEFLRLLAYAPDEPTRTAALAVLERADVEADESGPMPELAAAWLDLATHHPDPAVAARARQHLPATGPGALVPVRGGVLARPAPRLLRSAITAVDGQGRGTIVLSAQTAQGVATAAFACDLEAGVREVIGDLTGDARLAESVFSDLTGSLDRLVVENAHTLALGLLAGCLVITRPDAPTALPYWVEATAGPGFRPQPFPASFPDWDPTEVPFAEMPERSRDVLDACPDWLDTSHLTIEMAREIRLREGDSPPDPRRDAGAYRYLFEHGLKGQLERYRRMLLWMAWLWKATGVEQRARSALALALQLSDAQHVVPGHPFTVALTTRSLRAAQQALAGPRA